MLISSEVLSKLRNKYSEDVISKENNTTPLWVPLYLYLSLPKEIQYYYTPHLGNILLWLRPLSITEFPWSDPPWIAISNPMRYAAQIVGCTPATIYYTLQQEVYPTLYRK